MHRDDTLNNVLYPVLVIMVIVSLGAFLWMINSFDQADQIETHKTAVTYQRKVERFKTSVNQLFKQKYITIDQLKKITKRANKLSSDTDNVDSDRHAVNYLANKFDNYHVIDKLDGHVYMVHPKTTIHTHMFRQYNAMSYKLTPISNGNTSEVDSAWAKEHKKG